MFLLVRLQRRERKTKERKEILCTDEELAYKKALNCMIEGHIIRLVEYLNKLNINGEVLLEKSNK
jgi:hypothetical protein